MIIVTVVLCLPNKTSSLALIAANLTGIFFVLFTAIAGFTQASADTFTSDVLPEGADSIFEALPYILFSYSGFEAVSYAVEESKRPAEDVLPAYMWTLGVSTPLAVLMALSLAFMVTSTELAQCSATFGPLRTSITTCEGDTRERYWNAVVYAFDKCGMGWMVRGLSIDRLDFDSLCAGSPVRSFTSGTYSASEASSLS